jgi:SAM-dependent methyltransferase
MCSSWVSHLPAEVEYAEVVGHGMNVEELGKNRRLDRFFVRNLNESPGFSAEDKQFDAVLCCVSVQYLQRPEEVFAEVYRVLKPGGVFIVSFSNRMFYEKAISAWRDGSGFSRAGLVKEYFQCVEGFTKAEVVTEVGVAPDDSIVGKVRQFFKRSAGRAVTPRGCHTTVVTTRTIHWLSSVCV